MKKICHVTSVHPVLDARIFWKECLSLSKEYEVFLIAPNTYDRVENGVHILNVGIPSGRISRQFKLNMVYMKMLEVDADLYHFHDPELMYLGLKIKKLGKKIVFDSHEDVPMQILSKEYLPAFSKNTLSLLYSCFEKTLLKQYDALISVTPSIIERLETINSNTYMITNYPVLTEFEPTNETINSKDICFAGGVSVQYMHENVIKALSRTSATYLLAGPAYPGYLEKLKQIRGWEKVNYLGIVGHDKVFEIYKKSLAGVVLLDYNANVGYHRGTLGVLKLFEYMMVGIPVIATDFDLWKEIVEGCDCGICVNPHDINAIVTAIDFYISHPDVAKKKGKNGRKAVELKYNWGTQETALFKVYESIFQS